ncbi:MAG: four helix bundle protein [Lewinellaceae bacterium]|nr:four helix bundle protein [Lewinellaceae bacterium]
MLPTAKSPKLEGSPLYESAVEIGERIWKIVTRWGSFERVNLGGQLCRNADAIANNLAEGFGRRNVREHRNFSLYARGSLFGARTMLLKAHRRQMIKNSDFEQLNQLLRQCLMLLDAQIKELEEEA